MSEPPTYASVTEVPCRCGYLERAANDPDVPIRFDDAAGEYQFVYPEPGSVGPAMLILYHCPFCGGAAPLSKRSLLFVVIPRAEQDRLEALLAPITSIKLALQAFGPPALDDNIRRTPPEEEGQPPVVAFFRTLQYSHLSTVANVHITEREDGAVNIRLAGKAISDQP